MRRHCRSCSNARPLPLLLLLLLLPLLHFCGLRPHMARAAPQLTATQLQKKVDHAMGLYLKVDGDDTQWGDLSKADTATMEEVVAELRECAGGYSNDGSTVGYVLMVRVWLKRRAHCERSPTTLLSNSVRRRSAVPLKRSSSSEYSTTR